MRGQSLIARKGYAAIGKTEEPIVGEMGVALHEMDREEHLDDVLAGGEEIIGLIEETMAQTGTHNHTEKEVEKERIEQFVLEFLVFVQPFHDVVGQTEADEPAQTVPAHAIRPDVKCHQVGIPEDVS